MEEKQDARPAQKRRGRPVKKKYNELDGTDLVPFDSIPPMERGHQGIKLRRIKRQRLFLEYYKKSGFNISTACRKIKINRRTFYTWRDNDNATGEGHLDLDGNPITFAELLHEAEEEMKDFLEEKVYEQVRRKNPLVTIFVAKTKLKDRGFDERKTLKIEQDTLITKEQRDAAVRAYIIQRGDTLIKGVEGTADQVRKLMNPEKDQEADGVTAGNNSGAGPETSGS